MVFFRRLFMATIKDVANLAGVSVSTVSNVLSGKGNVSSKRMKQVIDAANQLGYFPSDSAKSLRTSTKNEIAVILPTMSLKRYRDVFNYAQKYLVNQKYDVSLFLTDNTAEKYTDAIKKVYQIRETGIICACNSFELDISMDQNKTIPIIYVDDLDKKDDSPFIGFDYENCGKEINRYLSEREVHEAVVLLDKSNKQDVLFLKGISGESVIDYHIVNISETDSLLQIIHYLRSRDIHYVVTTNNEWCKNIYHSESIAGIDRKIDIISLSGESIWRNKDCINYILDYKTLGDKAAEKILKLINGEEVKNEVLQAGGFDLEKKNINININKPLQMLILDSPTSRILSDLAPLCKKETGIDLKIISLHQQELYDSVLTSANTSFFDLARIDVLLLSELGPRAFLPLSEIPYDFSKVKSNMLPALPESYFDVNGISYALPFDPSILLLFYRKDLFQNPTIKRMFLEQYDEELLAPKTYAQFNKIAHFFTRKYNPKSPTAFGTTLILDNASSIACEFLPRLYEQSSFSSQPDSIDENLIREVCENYKETFDYTNKSNNMWWLDAAREFGDGKVAMTSLFINHASDLVEKMDPSRYIGISTLPGDTTLLGGGVLGVFKKSKNVQTCCDFISWVYSDQVAKMITYLGGSSPCESVFNNCTITNRYPWIKHAKENINKGKIRFQKNNIALSEREFENIIGLGIRNYTLGFSNVEDVVQYIKAALYD